MVMLFRRVGFVRIPVRGAAQRCARRVAAPVRACRQRRARRSSWRVSRWRWRRRRTRRWSLSARSPPVTAAGDAGVLRWSRHHTGAWCWPGPVRLAAGRRVCVAPARPAAAAVRPGNRGGQQPAAMDGHGRAGHGLRCAPGAHIAPVAPASALLRLHAPLKRLALSVIMLYDMAAAECVCVCWGCVGGGGRKKEPRRGACRRPCKWASCATR